MSKCKQIIRLCEAGFQPGLPGLDDPKLYWEVYVSAKTLPVQYITGKPSYAQESAKLDALKKVAPFVAKYELDTVGYNDVTIRVYDEGTARELVRKLNQRLSKADNEWLSEAPQGVHNAYAMPFEMIGSAVEVGGDEIRTDIDPIV